MTTSTLDPLQTVRSTVVTAPAPIESYLHDHSLTDPALLDEEESLPGFVQRARALVESTATPASIARLAKAEYDAGNRVSSCGAVRQLIEWPEPISDVAAAAVAVEVALGCGDYDHAQKLLDRIDPSRSPALAVLATSIAIRAGDNDRASEILAALPVQNPETLELRAVLALDAADHVGAIRLLRSAIRSEVHTPGAYISLAYAYSALGSPMKALTAAQTAVVLAPTSRVAGVNLAASLDALGRHAQALEVLDDLLEWYPEDLLLHFAVAEGLANSGDIAKALDRLSWLRTRPWFTELDPIARAERDALAAGLRWRAGKTTSVAAFKEAFNAFERTNYSSGPAAQIFAQTVARLDQQSAVERALERATGRCEDIDLYGLRVRLALMPGGAGLDAAAELIREWTRRDPVAFDPWAYGGYVELLRFRFDSAIELNRQGLRRFPNNSHLANNLAFALALNHQPAQARRALPDVGQDIAVRATTAAVTIAEGDVADGDRRYRQISADLRPADPEVADLVDLYRRFTIGVLTGRVELNGMPATASTVTGVRMVIALTELNERRR